MKTYTYDDYFMSWNGSEEEIEYTFESPIDLDESVFQEFIYGPCNNEIRAIIYCNGNANKLFHLWLEDYKYLIGDYAKTENKEDEEFDAELFMSLYEDEEDN